MNLLRVIWRAVLTVLQNQAAMRAELQLIREQQDQIIDLLTIHPADHFEFTVQGRRRNANYRSNANAANDGFTAGAIVDSAAR
jgi:hypothetical protein